MELLINRRNSVTLEDDGFAAVGVSWSKDGVEQGIISATKMAGVWSAPLPYMTNEGEIAVTWNITIPGQEIVTKTDYYRLVTPYLTKNEVIKICGDLTDDDARKIEAAARFTINAHCGQSFGKWEGSKRVYGTGEPYLALPERLESFSTVVGQPYVGNAHIINDGWYLIVPPSSFPPGNYYKEILEVPVRIPTWLRNSPYTFRVGAPYDVTGTWGWRTVPPSVVEAARLLVNDYSSMDSIYRDRYLTSMTAADWRIQFNEGAFRATGNARADQLLNNYVVQRGMAVI